MSETVNVQAKKQLAKLLATENITVVHAGTRTATFDPKRRILTLPIWKDMSGDLYDLLVLHEVGHALFTPPGAKPLIDACNAIDPAHPKAAKTFVNVLEDARIERLIKNLYPGARASFIRGYKSLIERNFFRTKGRDLAKMGVIDRMNIHFKTGAEFDIPFTDLEMEFVKRIQEALTFDEIVEIGKELYVYAKKERAEKKKQEQAEQEQEMEDEKQGESNSRMRSSRMPGEEGDEDDETLDPDADGSEDLPEEDDDSDLETDDNDSDEEGNEDGSNDGKDHSDDSGDDQEGGDEDEEGDDNTSKEGSDEEEGNDDEESDEDGKENGKTSGPEEEVDDSPIESETDNSWNETQDDLRDKDAKTILYLGIPEPKLDNIIVGYKEVHQNIRTFYESFDRVHHTGLIPQHMGEFERFKAENKPVVAWLVKEFEMHKAADQYARTSVAKTGALDLSRLHEYRYSDDIMKRNAIIPGGKNHANLLFLDYSGSMRNHMLGSIHQLINLAMFHRKVNTNFRAFTFGAMDPKKYAWEARGTRANNTAFTHKADDFGFHDTLLLREILSSKMTAREFNEACVNLLLIASGASRSEWTSGTAGTNYVQLPPTDQLGATPLNEAIVAAIPLTQQMYKSGAQFVSLTFITDGEATTDGLYSKNDFGDLAPIDTSRTQVFIRDSVTHEDYEYTGYTLNTTDTLLRILRNRTGATAVGFFISGEEHETEKAFRLFLSKDLTTQKIEEYKKKMEKDYYVVSTQTGYDEFYILPGGKKLKINQASSPLTGLITNAQLVTAMTDHGLMQRKQRVLLTRYIKLIS